MTPREQRLALVARVAAEHGLTLADMQGPATERRISLVRDIAIRRVADAFGGSNHQIGELFGRSHSSVWAALHRERKRAQCIAWLRRTQATRVTGMCA